MSRGRYDVIVVGSGAGGGVAASELARGGARVLLLEEGPWVRTEQFDQRDRHMYPLLFRDAGLQATEDTSVTVLQGRCVGGSTVVNQADVTFIPAELFEHWRDRYGLRSLTLADLEPGVAEIKRIIGANRIAESALNANNRLLLEGARKLGLRGGTFENNRVGCIGSGYCHIGCAYDAKRSVQITFIPRGIAAGLEVQPETRVERILTRRRRVVGVEVTRRRGDKRVKERYEAGAVFLCAGAIHTPLILARSRLGNRHVGRHLSLQPQAPIVAVFPRRIVAWRGIPQAAYVDHFETVSRRSGFGGFRIEGIFGPPGTASAFLPGIGPEMLRLLLKLDRVAAALVLVPDQPHGRVVPYGSALYPRILYTPSDEVLARLREGLLQAAEIYLSVGAEEVWFPVEGAPPVRSARDLARARQELRLEPVAVRLISAHPQGTARMSDEARLGAVSPEFQLYGVKGLYVADGSLFPTTSSSHTQLPIMAMGWLAAHRFLSAS